MHEYDENESVSVPAESILSRLGCFSHILRVYMMHCRLRSGLRMGAKSRSFLNHLLL